MLEKMDFSIENPLGFKRMGCVTGIAMNNDYPGTKTTAQEVFGVQLTYRKGATGKAIITGEGAFVTYVTSNQPLSFYRDPTNRIGKEQQFSGDRIMSRSDTPNTGLLVENASALTFFALQGFIFDTLDLIELKSLTYLGLGNNNVENVDFIKIIENNPSLKEVRLINGGAVLELKEFQSLENLEVLRLHNNNEDNFWFPYNGINENITGDIADLYLCTKLKQLDCFNTRAYGDYYELVQRYRENGRTSGNIKSNNLGLNFTFNGIPVKSYWDNIMVWDNTHAYIATNTKVVALTGKKMIYYVGYSDAEVEEMKQGLWSGVTDANIINCG